MKKLLFLLPAISLFILNFQAQTPAQWKKDYVYGNGQLIGVVSPGNFALSVAPSTLTMDQGQTTTYTVTVTGIDGFASTVQLAVAGGLPAGATPSFAPSFVTPGQSSVLTITATLEIATGSFNFVVAGTSGNQVNSATGSLTIRPRQTTSLSFSVASVFAGLDCTMVTVGNGANMTVDLQWQYTPWAGGNLQPDSWFFGPLDGNGQKLHCPGQSTPPGDYLYLAIKNTLRAEYVTLVVQPKLTVRPPKPTSLLISPSRVTVPQNYSVAIGNAATQTVLQENRNPAGVVGTATYSLGSDGTLGFSTDCGYLSGTYTVQRLRNNLDPGADAWFTPQAPDNTLTVDRGSCPP